MKDFERYAVTPGVPLFQDLFVDWELSASS